jgi:hypothetical protein
MGPKQTDSAPASSEWHPDAVLGRGSSKRICVDRRLDTRNIGGLSHAMGTVLISTDGDFDHLKEDWLQFIYVDQA